MRKKIIKINRAFNQAEIKGNIMKKLERIWD